MGRLFGGNPSFFWKRKRGERKRRRGNRDDSPSGPPPQCTPGGEEGPASAEVRTHIRESLSPLTRGFGLAL